MNFKLIGRIVSFFIFASALISCTGFSAELPYTDPSDRSILKESKDQNSNSASGKLDKVKVTNLNKEDKIKGNTQQTGSENTDEKVGVPQKDQNINRLDEVQIINKSKEIHPARVPEIKPVDEELPKKTKQSFIPDDPMEVELFDWSESEMKKADEEIKDPDTEKTQQSETQHDVGMEAKDLPIIKPLYVQALMNVVPGHNDSNPVWSPSGEFLAFERSIGDKREIIVSQLDGSEVQKIYCRSSKENNELDIFLPGIIDDVSYNAGISWSPDGSRLVFMSNGGSGNYDLYLLSALGDETTIRLTEHAEKDSHPNWSPNASRLVFVSGRSGTAEIYTMDLDTRKITQLTFGHKTFLYPQWSPDGKRIVMIYGSNENHDIYLIEDIERPVETLRALTTWDYDDLRPVWSPDGSKIAFYSNYNLENNPKLWSIIVINADGSDPSDGEDLAKKVVARNVIPDIERGPAWMPDNNSIIYVSNDQKAYNPIYLYDLEKKTIFLIKTDTKMNHDVVCSTNGTIAFRAQVEQWDHIYITQLKE